ncbi:hypothetical protein [Streptacidiphilus albus]|uniref:hypothetical protein n=1 Tax=Streptacidiphilus albus TaxID=105425 RepID=UPI00054BE92D|nr:hypothetical protein [Streptacidiphilus albus]
MEDHRTLLSLLSRQLRISAYADFVIEFNAKAAALTASTGDSRYRSERVDERRWRRWKNGEVSTAQGAAGRILEEIFDRSVSELLAPPPPDDAQPAPQIDESELLMTAHEAADRAGDFASHRISPIDLEQIQDHMTRLARSYGTQPPVTVYREARRLHTQITARLDQTAVPAQTQDLHFAAGVTSALLSQVCFDLGSRAAAATLARASRMHGEVIGHAPLQAFADCTLALLAYWDGYPEQAVRIIQRAQTYPLGGAGAIRRASIAARAYAHVGDEASARRELTAAAEADRAHRDDLHDGLAGEFAFPEHRRLLSAGSALLAIGDAQAAADTSGEALAVVWAMTAEQRPHKVLGEAAADQALARLRLGDLDGAAESLETVFRVPAEVRVDGLIQRIVPVRIALSQSPYRGSPPARAMAAQLEDFALDSVPTLVGGPPAIA